MDQPDSKTRRNFLLNTMAVGATTLLAKDGTAQTKAAAISSVTVPSSGAEDRASWLTYLEKVSEPVLHALSEHKLRATMPIMAAPGLAAERAVGSPLEAFGRLLAGLAPWLELEPSAQESQQETALRSRYRKWALAAITSAVDPASPDYMRFGASSQTVVDASFLALALLRAPRQLVQSLDAATRQRLIQALKAERIVLPGYNNWLLFAAINEALLMTLGADWDRVRVDYALRKHMEWFVGDGTYGDGPHYHADYYDSFVIHPYLLQLIETLGDTEPAWKNMRPAIHARAQRYAAIQERVISPQGEYPIVGRSITYRCGAFHLLADCSRRHMLPEIVLPQQVRCALTAVQHRTLTPAGTFSSDGWLQIGLAGLQPSLGETYISTGSLYLASAAWLPLGLPPSDTFWSAPASQWTQQKAWSGIDIPVDHAHDE
ncbi:DUF2264 domain-containing protein [Edaphobacter dinghuensis]|uniref:DUF2264 domain-containing protein n=1 Tax=Edaphobacter dinghuensis TaxID=1560005 RepID=A0A917LZS7_9BACT|nr:DUF2264 domain-containing protein [Edaphobacter dinghuensis]GGG68467.1 hypothetical protein GCM10011585_08020 [Edaphobacter dinghuensis]